MSDKQLKPYQHLPNFATIRYPNNAEYSGQVLDGKRHGKGRLFHNILDFTDGEWINDELSGRGVCQMPNGDRYEGDFHQGKFHGVGTLFYSNKCWYKGDFVTGKKHGQGTETSPSGMTYTGAFENDKPNGHGVQIQGDYSFKGGFQDGVKNGQGTENYRDASYTGNFLKGLKNGKGVWKHQNGNSYKGDWQLGQKHGYGVETKIEVLENFEKREEIYEGEFLDGYREGYGRLSTGDNGTFCYGFWHRGLKTGLFLNYNGADKQYTQQEFDFGKPLDKPIPISVPEHEEDGFRRIIESSVVRGEKITDPEVHPSDILKYCEKFTELDREGIEWLRISEVFNPAAIQFFPNERPTLEYSKYSNYQLLTVLETLLHYPSQLFKFFSPHYSVDLGYYIVRFFVNGKWKQVLVDDQIPFLREENIPLTSSSKSKNHVGFHLIEKAWAKLTSGYFSCLFKPKKPEYVIEMLTGISPQQFSFQGSEKHSSWDTIISEKYRHYKAKFVIPKPEFAHSMGLPVGYFYTIIDHLQGEPNDLIKLKSIDKTKILESKWNDTESWPPHMLRRLKLSGSNELNEEGTFWIESEKLLELFECALICPLQENSHHFSFLRRGNFEVTKTNHEMRIFEFEVPFKSPVSLVVTQLSANTEYLPMRLILAKKTDILNYEYIFGRGQFSMMSMHRTLLLDSGIYHLCVHLENPKKVNETNPTDLSVVISSPTSIRLKPKIDTIPQFLNKAYSSCAKKFGEKSDLSKFENGSDKLMFYQLFRGDDGIFVQHFINNSENVRWKFNANFTLTNMKIVGLPEHRQQVDITVEPKKSHTLLIMQTGGKNYEFLGGQGSVNLEVIEKPSRKLI